MERQDGVDPAMIELLPIAAAAASGQAAINAGPIMHSIALTAVLGSRLADPLAELERKSPPHSEKRRFPLVAGLVATGATIAPSRRGARGFVASPITLR